MEETSFERGQTAQKLTNIEQDVNEMKIQMKEHNISDKKEFEKLNDKVDIVHDAAKDAARTALRTAEIQSEQEKINTERHNETSLALVNINESINKLTKDQSDIKLKMYLLAAFIGGGSGSLVPLIKDWFL